MPPSTGIQGINARFFCLKKIENYNDFFLFKETSALGRAGQEKDEDYNLLRANYDKSCSELELAKEEIRCLGSQNSELKSQIEVLSSETRESSLARPTPDENVHGDFSSVSSSSSTSIDASEKIPIRIKSSDNNRVSPVSTVSSSVEYTPQINGCHQNGTPIISKDVAFLKIEQKFNEAMEKIAGLTSEKEQLEHIIVRLQEETDTVGEYITLYQYQRSQQRYYIFVISYSNFSQIYIMI